VRELFQLGDPALVPSVVDAAQRGDREALLSVWDDLTRQGADPGRFLLRCSAELKERYLQSADRRWLNALDAAWQGVNLLKYESFPALLVELTLLRISAALNQSVQPETAQAQQQQSPPQLPPAGPPKPEAKPESAVQDKPATQAPARRPWDKDKPARQPVPAAKTPAANATSPPASGANGVWQKFLDDLQRHHLTTYSHLVRGVSGRIEGQRLRILFNPGERQTYGFAVREIHLQAMAEAARRVIGASAQVAVELSGSSQPPVVAGGPAEQRSESEPPPELLHDIVDEQPLQDSGEVDAEQLERAAAEMSFDPEVDDIETRRPTAQDAISLFDATELEPEE
jgi:DNA polymerase III gamma/tau subunit